MCGGVVRFRVRRGILFLTEAKQKGTVPRLVPQLLHIFFLKFKKMRKLALNI